MRDYIRLTLKAEYFPCGWCVLDLELSAKEGMEMVSHKTIGYLSEALQLVFKDIALSCASRMKDSCQIPTSLFLKLSSL